MLKARENSRKKVKKNGKFSGADPGKIYSLLMLTFLSEKVENTGKECYTTVEND